MVSKIASTVFLLFLLVGPSFAAPIPRTARLARRSEIINGGEDSPPPSDEQPSDGQPSDGQPSGTKDSQGSYKLEDQYKGSDFLNEDKFAYFTAADPTHGSVHYQSKDNAEQQGLVKADDNTFTMSVDSSNAGSDGFRNSVRISSTKTYNTGLFIADIQTMPYGPSLWPAYWLVGPNWPNGGEIDIVEGVNDNTENQMTLHTSEGCKLDSSLQSDITGTMGNLECASSGSNNAGCAVKDKNSNSYGQGFNDNGGGVWATLVNSTGIKIWFFARGDSKLDSVTGSGGPQPDQWGNPTFSIASNTCDIASHFKDLSITFDITLCGDWAGSAQPNCPAAVLDNNNFKNPSFVVNSVSVYQPA